MTTKLEHVAELIGVDVQLLHDAIIEVGGLRTRAAPASDQLLVEPVEAALRLSVSRATVYRLIASGELEAVSINSKRLVPVEALHDYVERLRL